MRSCLIGILAFAAATPSAAHESRTTWHSVPTAEQLAAAQAVTDKVMERIEARDVQGAVDLVAQGSPLMREKVSELSLVVGQAKNADTLYGPVEKCSLGKHTHTSALRIDFAYICQHRDFLLEWVLRADNVASGWVITNFSFSDNF